MRLTSAPNNAYNASCLVNCLLSNVAMTTNASHDSIKIRTVIIYLQRIKVIIGFRELHLRCIGQIRESGYHENFRFSFPYVIVLYVGNNMECVAEAVTGWFMQFQKDFFYITSLFTQKTFKTNTKNRDNFLENLHRSLDAYGYLVDLALVCKRQF